MIDARHMNRMDPFRELSKIQDEMNRLFDSTFSAGGAEYPPVNIWSDADQAVVTAEIPGINPADIHLSIQNDELVVEGVRSEFRVKEGEEVHRQERTFGPFRRSVPLPYKTDAGKIEAKYKDGILKVRLPRHEAEKPRQIEIAAEA